MSIFILVLLFVFSPIEKPIDYTEEWAWSITYTTIYDNELVYVLQVGGTVFAIDSEYIHITTNDNNGWVLDYTTGYNIGDKVILIINTKNTPEIYDDELIEIINLGQ